MKWNDDKQLQMLLPSLKEDAIDWYLNSKQVLAQAGPLTYAAIKQQLCKRFQTPNNDFFARLALNRIRQEPDETVLLMHRGCNHLDQWLSQTSITTSDISY